MPGLVPGMTNGKTCSRVLRQIESCTLDSAPSSGDDTPIDSNWSISCDVPAEWARQSHRHPCHLHLCAPSSPQPLDRHHAMPEV